MMKIFTAVESQALVRSRDKLRSLQILARAGIGMPKSAFANEPKDIESVIASIGGAPCVVKLLEGTQGIGVILAENQKAAQAAPKPGAPAAPAKPGAPVAPAAPAKPGAPVAPAVAPK
jgi:glutathione synthase/RimK-type ligase-like ATP-grasp enzyme